MRQRHLLLVCLVIVAFQGLVFAEPQDQAAFSQDEERGNGVPFTVEGQTYADQKAFIDSGHRCATTTPDHATVEHIDSQLQRFGPPGGGIETRAAGSVTVQVWWHVIRKGTGISNGDIPQSQIDASITVLNNS